MTPRQAGWSIVGEDPDAVPFCPGGGQVALFAVEGERVALPCAVCGRLVRAAYDVPAGRFIVTDHYPPAPEAPTLSLGL